MSISSSYAACSGSIDGEDEGAREDEATALCGWRDRELAGGGGGDETVTALFNVRGRRREEVDGGADMGTWSCLDEDVAAVDGEVNVRGGRLSLLRS